MPRYTLRIVTDEPRQCVAFVLLAWLLAVAIAFPAAILVLATTTAAVGGSLLPAHTIVVIVAVLTAIGSPLALAAGVMFAYTLFTRDGIAGESVPPRRCQAFVSAASRSSPIRLSTCHGTIQARAAS